MFNLILKDILIQKRTFLWGIVYILIMVLSFQQSGIQMFLASVVAFTYVLVQSACYYDEKNKSDILLNSLPVSRNIIVTARYLSIFIFAAIAVIYYILLTGIITMLRLPIKAYPVTLEGIIVAIFSLVLVTGIYFPIFFKVGYIKSKIVNFVLFFGVFYGGAILLSELMENRNSPLIKSIIGFFSNQSDVQIMAGFFVLMILLLLISYMFSLKFYSKREL